MKALKPDDSILIDLPAQDLIPYFDGLPSQGAKLTYMLGEEFSNKFRCIYQEGLWVNSKVRQTLRWNKEVLKKDGVISGISTDKLHQEIQKIMVGTAENFLAIAKMDPLVGHGVFAIRDIPKHTVLCLYSGEIKAGKEVFTRDTNDVVYYTGNFHIEASSKRGIASFMQHLPGDTRPFKSSRESIAVTNVMSEFIEVDNIPLVALVSLRNISALEQVGFSYGDFWKTRGIPQLFYHSGEIIPRSKYSLQELAASHGYDAPSCQMQQSDCKNADRIRQEIRFKFSGKPTIAMVKIVDHERKTIERFAFTDIGRFSVLQSLIGTQGINKIKDRNEFEIQRNWMVQVNETNPPGILELAELLGVPELEFRKKLNLPKPKNDTEYFQRQLS